MGSCHTQGEQKDTDHHKTQKFAMKLSLVTAIFILAIKVGAYLLTRSSAILGDAAESVIHIVAVGLATYSLHLSLKPPDKKYPYGYM